MEQILSLMLSFFGYLLEVTWETVYTVVIGLMPILLLGLVTLLLCPQYEDSAADVGEEAVYK